MKIENPISADSSCKSAACIPAYIVMALSGLMGGVSMALFAVFLYTGLPSHVDLGLGEHTKLCLNTLLCFLFFFQHSFMLRKGFRNWVSGFVPANYIGACYSIFSGFFLLVLMLFWQKATLFRIEFDGAAHFLMRALFFLSIIGFFFTVRYLPPFDPLGIEVIFSRLKGKRKKESFLAVRGAYRWVRHPIYFLSLLMIWSQVSVTPDRLLFNGLWTFWIIIGAFLEERDLIATFGDAYRDYQQEVPMLIPCGRFFRPSTASIFDEIVKSRILRRLRKKFAGKARKT
jgi:methanethiol S-methyltransferase